MIGYILITLFVLLLIWILLGPVIVYMNTDQNRYLVTLPGVISASLVPSENLFYIRGWIFFIPFRINPFKKRKEKIKDSGEKKKKPSKKRFRKQGMLRKILHAIRIRRLQLDIDTDDFPLNAWLVPFFSAVNYYDNIHMQVNFEGNLFLHLDLRTRLGALMWILFIKK